MLTCWIIAGPNGAGKTTFALQQATAGRLLLREIQTNVQRRTDFALETTVSGRGYLKLVDSLRAAGWRVELIYLALPDKAMSHHRVAERVAHGGHDIPAADIERRFARSLRHLLHDFSQRVDLCECFLNSGNAMEPVFTQTGTARVVKHPSHYQHLVQESQQ